MLCTSGRTCRRLWNRNDVVILCLTFQARVFSDVFPGGSWLTLLGRRCEELRVCGERRAGGGGRPDVRGPRRRTEAVHLPTVQVRVRVQVK